MSFHEQFLTGSLCKRVLLGAALVSVFFVSCDAPNPYEDDLPTKGHVLILADEDLRSLVEAEELVFESIYTKAELDIRYLPEAQLLKAVLNDSVRCWIATVQPGGEQEAYYAKRTVRSHVVPICMDGIAVVVNKSCKLDRLSIEQLKSALTSPTRFQALGWSVGNEAGPLEPPLPLFVAAGSGVARALVDSLFGQSEELKISALSMPDLNALVERVALDPRAIGIVSFAAISDLDNPQMKALRDKVKLVAISGADGSTALLPSQSTLADGSYPLRRQVCMILCEGKSGLGTGFVSFVANHKGQRIILKQGLAPQKVPPRDVEIVP